MYIWLSHNTSYKGGITTRDVGTPDAQIRRRKCKVRRERISRRTKRRREERREKCVARGFPDADLVRRRERLSRRREMRRERLFSDVFFPT